MHKWLITSLLIMPLFLGGEREPGDSIEVDWTSSILEVDYRVGEEQLSKAYSTLATKEGSQARILIEIDTASAYGEELLLLAEELHLELEEMEPGLSRGIIAKADSSLQQRHVKLNIGGVDNTSEELENSLSLVKELIDQLEQ
ncbi:stage II sporulation protein P [Shouchella hunanensis]|uniref:Stage II sporulation protein P n=1 Tax=Shouchella hunanensis TaxID=766894 RepID=A0ABY7W2R4_9BACI|nr:stage II sporulation protein P [Shouchella hunanensis]WDF02341.1 stage II sporulation protein P [Shouchella hunanensis]